MGHPRFGGSLLKLAGLRRCILAKGKDHRDQQADTQDYLENALSDCATRAGRASPVTRMVRQSISIFAPICS